ncbi:CPBP family intramembrane glutamic endopeptidase [Microbacter margulisiae]|uniref:CAAX prenyl protease 2/Lysostaphin resistance protein A-like domain-containing protein n=1 Tax=Microbacter margulisiae TaxID=1350067 RepID=A0A7W5DR11_9PORP|nr:CPBP family intramembrane glutamic endopeptidase [Microbacter margulisiae]MBB3187499.1 hypothetical protein [Microbacter margulisiae]
MNYQKPGLQGLLLIVLSLGVTIVTVLIWQLLSPWIAVTLHYSSSEWLDNINYLKGLQLLTSVSMFLMPPVLLAFILKQPVALTLYFHRIKKPLLWIVVFCSMIVAQPFINWLGDWNAKLILPAWLSGLEHWMKAMEQESDQIVNRFLTVHSLKGLLFNIILIAIVPAFAEEFFFRGTVQRLFAQKMNIHLSIWITAAIFSAVHVEFYGFIPRLLLGAYLGYLLAWSGSIWIPVLAHFANNFIGVFVGYWMANHVGYDYLDHIGSTQYGWMSVAGICLFIPMVWFIYKHRNTVIL